MYLDILPTHDDQSVDSPLLLCFPGRDISACSYCFIVSLLFFSLSRSPSLSFSVLYPSFLFYVSSHERVTRKEDHRAGRADEETGKDDDLFHKSFNTSFVCYSSMFAQESVSSTYFFALLLFLVVVLSFRKLVESNYFLRLSPWFPLPLKSNASEYGSELKKEVVVC